ncbi:MBL fold metallo-hydrolase [Robertmurraya andreesenii]|uniref:Glyoxylase-like metal-dependent hydrolase (Beta-lactamase superfamily II) n=1 Tax=Anoxybacillus andreesenii TaxID=1325932 RepID=A0ABT9V615_9BACL|nr:MBL fold metallo-hydrolase [Robertmurraya andreesenii]MDQ0156396.1 glyoxylase-like metal-dependent hydrolase (beta-lactamase superfamily II) [Robertmurraya andreesenii]
MNWEQIPLGPLQTNCYIIANKEKKCLIFDPGEEGSKLIRHLEQRKLTPLAILLTHAHFDHIGAVDDIRNRYHIPVYLHEQEKGWLMDPALNGSQFFMMGPIKVNPADHVINGEGKMEVGDFSFEVFATPGHSPGSVSYYFEDGFVVSGDALFQGSIGRTDLPGGNHEVLIKSIHEKLLVLPEETQVLPGHGPTTTIESEMDSNPFLNGF